MRVVPNLRFPPHFDFIVQFGGGWERPIWIWDKDLLPGERCSRTGEDLGPKFMKLDSEDSGHISIQIPWHILHSPITQAACFFLPSVFPQEFKWWYLQAIMKEEYTHTWGLTETSKQFLLLLAFKSIIAWIIPEAGLLPFAPLSPHSSFSSPSPHLILLTKLPLSDIMLTLIPAFGFAYSPKFSAMDLDQGLFPTECQVMTI